MDGNTGDGPRLSVRAMGSMLGQPAYDQVRTLHDQKHPRQGPQSFRVPFYTPALKAIRDYYRSGRDAEVLAVAREQFRKLRPESKAMHNRRVLDQFERSRQARRPLEVRPNRRHIARVGDVEIRLQFDVTGLEGGTPKGILYHLPDVPIDREVARRTIDIAHWVLQQNDIDIPIRCIEYVDIGAGKSHRLTKRRATTIRHLKQNARIIATLWPTV